MTTTVREPALVPVAPSIVTEADVLRRAADLLEEFGWCQLHYGSKAQGQFCLVGAIAEAADELGLSRDQPRDQFGYPSSYDHLRALRLAGEQSPWNDAPGRTKAEVVQRLREAAEAAA